jgi:hypothetical protein
MRRQQFTKLHAARGGTCTKTEQLFKLNCGCTCAKIQILTLFGDNYRIGPELACHLLHLPHIFGCCRKCAPNCGHLTDFRIIPRWWLMKDLDVLVGHRRINFFAAPCIVAPSRTTVKGAAAQKREANIGHTRFHLLKAFMNSSWASSQLQCLTRWLKR